MTAEQKAAVVRARVAQFECRREAMVAENKQREIRGESMAYVATHFDGLEAEFPELQWNNLVTFFAE